MNDLADRVRAGLAARADAAAAESMRAYMRSAMPFHGVPKPARTALLRELSPPDDPAVLRAAADALWDDATHREERYVAVALARRTPPDPERLPVLERWVRTAAWWDLVDEIAAHLVGPLLRAHPARAVPVVRRWATDPDRWLRRTAVVAHPRLSPLSRREALRHLDPPR